jgi:hypothetical protein
VIVGWAAGSVQPFLNFCSTGERESVLQLQQRSSEISTHIEGRMAFRNFEYKRRCLRRDALARIPAEVILSVPWSNLAKQTGNFGIVSARLAALILACNLWASMAILIKVEHLRNALTSLALGYLRCILWCH